MSKIKEDSLNIDLDAAVEQGLRNLGIFDENINFNLLKQPADSPWKEKPEDFVTFCEDKRFLGREEGIIPSKNQYRVAFASLGGNPNQDLSKPVYKWKVPDPLDVFSKDRKIRWTAVVAGKGGGKDFIVARIVAYCIYLLACLKDPQLYLTGYSSDSTIDIINVSQVARQAKRIFFRYLKENIKNCEWFRRNFRIREGHKFLDVSDSSYPLIEIAGTSILFPNHVRAFAETSNFEASEGYNTLVYILDEVSALSREGASKSSDEFFRTFSTSVRTRFGNKGFGLMFSWPRAAINDFILDKYNEAERVKSEDERYAHGFRFMTHEFLPEDYKAFSGKKELYIVNIDKDAKDFILLDTSYDIQKGHLAIEVPVELMPGINEDVEDFSDFEAKILCIPPAQAGALIRHPATIDACVIPDEEYKPLYKLDEDTIDKLGSTYSVKRIIARREMGIEQRQTPRIIFVDKSLTTDLTCVIIGYGKPHTFTDVDASGKEYSINGILATVEQLIVWEPDKKKDILVSLLNVDDIILDACSYLNVKKVAGDEWEPASPERYRGQGIEFERKIVSSLDWENLASAFYAGRIRIPNYKPLIIDLKTLVRDGKKVSHSDIAYSVCGFYSYLNDPSLIRVLSISRPRPTLAYIGDTGAGLSTMKPIVPSDPLHRGRITTMTTKKRPYPKLVRT